jgi:Flp pilus assembly protein TadB
MAAALALLGLSIPLQQRLFAAAGLAAVFAYLGKLVFDVFESANAALVLVVLGLLVLGLGMLYQRYNERLFQRPRGT